MAFETVSLGLTLSIPTAGTTSWGPTVKSATWKKISQHKHTGSGDGNQIPTGGLENNAVTTDKLSKNYGHTQAATVSPSGTTATLDFNNGNVQKLDVSGASGDVTVTLSNPSAGSSYRIFVVQGATLRDIIWPAAVKWPQAQKLIVSDVNNTDMVELYYDGTNYYGTWELDLS